MNFQGIRNSSVDQTGPTVIEASRISGSTSLAMSRKDESKGAFEQTTLLLTRLRKVLSLAPKNASRVGHIKSASNGLWSPNSRQRPV